MSSSSPEVKPKETWFTLRRVFRTKKNSNGEYQTYGRLRLLRDSIDESKLTTTKVQQIICGARPIIVHVG